ncbi:helix-turn-helix transcriptional regulator [Actinophytocola sp.]|uniref:helix-turn-helix transcriptional regulator n=1 Tax=Actinophytocola sp. TaxID=1872138 RepID=UPI002D3F3618|nr:LuxR C-terminal-related transcriptional regulator [Actinophytocola sp.]HYQ63754.1 LuxR C-terminal-related transcriptional regulator [Actinophytocola sp.]
MADWPAMSDLPVPLTTFVGRVAELAALAGALGSARVVTVAGPGGCGKTRLAVAAAGRFDGVRWADLSGMRDPAAVPEVVAAAVGVLRVPDQALFRDVAGARLVCLDNCEHVLDAAADVAVELARSGVTVLATSREPLGVPGEVVWRVPPLSGADAVTLFRARAGVADSAELRTACARLDGIPLAIELAAAWSSTLSVPEILRGLDDRFALLVRGPRGVAARQATLAASMAWSHDLLDDADRVLFRRLGVFAGGFTRASAEAVCDGEVLGGLRRLVDKSLVVADTRDAVTRYRMLETIRQYAVSKLAASDEEAGVRGRHLATMLAMVDELAPLLDRDKDAWRVAVETEQENLGAALGWGLRWDPERARRLAAGLPWLWHLNRHGLAGLALLREAVDLRPDARDALQARLLTGLALVADTARPIGLEYDAAQAAYEIATEAGDVGTASLARLLSAVGMLYTDFDTAWSLATEARAGGDGFVVDGAVALLGIVKHLRDEHDAAMSLLREAVAGLSRRGDRGVASTALGFLACSALYTGDVAAARSLAEEGVRTARPLADYHRIGSAAAVLATVELAVGRLDTAAEVLAPVLRLVADAEHAPFVPGLARTVGQLRLLSGTPAEAVEWFHRETAWLDGFEGVYLAPQTLTGLAAALRATGDVDGAAGACTRALALAREIGMPRVVADALAEQAFLDPARAVELQQEALAIRAEHGLWLSCVDSLRALARLTADPVLLDENTDLRTRVDYARRSRGRRGRPSSGWASLTPAERSVVRLAADGLSNPDIGSRLFMSRSTVKTHLSHVYAKLDVTNRTELANLAALHLPEVG